MTHAKYKLPQNWTWTTIGEITAPVAKVHPEDAPRASFVYLDITSIDNEINRIVEPKEYLGSDAPSRARQQVEAGDVLFSTVRTYLRNIAMVPKTYDGQIASTGFAVLRGKDSISNRYLFYFTLTEPFLASLSEKQRGTSYPAVRDSDVRSEVIPLAPFREQQRIVAEIEKHFTRLDATIANLRRLQQNLDRYRASVLKAAFEGRLVPQDPADKPAEQLLERILEERRRRWEEEEWQKQVERAKKKVAQARRKEAGLPYYIRDLEPEDWEDVAEEEYREYLPKGDKWKEKYEEPLHSRGNERPSLPLGWSWTSLDSLIVSGPQNGLYLPQSSYGAGTPILRIEDYQNGQSQAASDLKKVQADVDAIQTYSLEVGDLIINRVNSPSHLGKCLVVVDRNVPSLFESNMMRLRLSSEIEVRFIEYYLRSSDGKSRLTSNAKWAVNQASINQTDVSKTPVPLAPLNEQKKIVEEIGRRLSIAEELEQTIMDSLIRAERLRQSVLEKAFTGRLIPQDPSDEPASQLLDRIKT